MRFAKMHGAGNDYIYLDGFSTTLPENPAELSKRLSDRHTGIGADGLILIRPSEQAHAEMQMFNADGSQAEMCGNGIRCVAKYLVDRGLADGESIDIQTDAGIKRVNIVGKEGDTTFVRVDMGPPDLNPISIPTLMSPNAEGRAIQVPLKVDDIELLVSCVSMGNPHCIVIMDDHLWLLDDRHEDQLVHELGPQIEKHPMFPSRTNVEFVWVTSKSHVRQRTWERGSGETMACGTGACAVVVAAVLAGHCLRTVQCQLNGGALDIEWREDSDHVFMTGPAVEVFQGEL